MVETWREDQAQPGSKAPPPAPSVYHMVKGKGCARTKDGPPLTSCGPLGMRGGKALRKGGLDMISAGISKQTRRAVYKRDGWRCALCDSTQYIQIHHCVPRGEGGTDHEHNLITLCADCHALAHGMDLRGWGATKEDVEQAIVEYLADYYAEQGILWNPWNTQRGRHILETLEDMTPEEAAQAGMEASMADVHAVMAHLMLEDPAVERRHGKPEEPP